MDSVDQGLAWLLEEDTCLLPIVHAEADFKAPVKLGAVLTINVRMEPRGDHSFMTTYVIHNAQDAVAAEATLVHVAIDPASGKSMPLPETLKVRLTGITG